MTYTAHELDGMQAQAERDNAAHEAACRERVPLACALQDELAAAMAPAYTSGTFDARWSALAQADRWCQEAKDLGRDLSTETVGRIRALLAAPNARRAPAATEARKETNVSTEAMVARDAGRTQGGDALAMVQRDAGVMALATMSEQDFEQRLKALKLGQERVRRIQKELMTGPTEENPEGEDYGVIPGTKKPTLLKPGAEKICNVYGLVPVFEETWIEGDGVTTPHLRVRLKCRLHRGSAEGPVVGEGGGAANSWERKHRYRAALRSCPECGCEGTIKRSSFEKDGDRGWYCHARVGGCAANFHSTDPAIVEQQGGQVDNPDPYDVENTLLKMASKRAQVDATLRATATSGLFTQDVEDNPPDAPPPKGKTAPVATVDAQVVDADGDGDSREYDPERVYASHGVEPPAQPQRTATRAPRNGGPQSGAGRVACPHCGKPAGASKFPKDGKTHYCYDCKHPFDPKSAR